jgi:hypothetical protein
MNEINPNEPTGQPSHKDAKAQAKAAKAYAKAQRPFYKKKRFIFPAAVVAVFLMVQATNGGGDDTPTADDVSTAAVAEADTDVKTSEQAEPASAPTEEAEPEMTAGQENALQAADNYIEMMPFSHDGLIQQLSSPAGDGYSKADATFAADHVEADWNEEAAEAAMNYLDTMPFSHDGLIQQLTSAAGDKFTQKQAVYGVKKAGL